MESDFVTRQHLDSLSDGDTGFSEVLNRYRMSGTNHNFQGMPTHHPQNFGNPYYGLPGHGDAILLSNMLGQIQASVRPESNKLANYEGFQLNINSDVLKWIGLLLLVLLLVYLFLRVNRKKPSIGKKIENLHKEVRNLKSLSRYHNPEFKEKITSDSDYSDDDSDDSDEIEESDDSTMDLDYEDLDDLDFSEEA